MPADRSKSQTGPLVPASAPSIAWTAAKKPVLLTFDDGPSTFTTPTILDVLQRYGIKAIFFVVGERLRDGAHRDLLERVLRDGHRVGNHSFTHPDLATATPEQTRWEIEETQALLEELGVRDKLFRPPYGNFNDGVANYARLLGLWGMGWTADTSDWDASYQPDRWISEGYTHAQQHRANIVLLHDIHVSTAAGLGIFIERLIAAGCSFPSLFSETNADSSACRVWEPAFNGWETIPDLRLYRPRLD